MAATDSRGFVGRTTELQILDEALAAALAGRGRLVLVAGEPGIGKTSLAETLGARASARGARVLWGRCWEGGAAPAYWPWRQIFRAYLQCAPAALAAEMSAGATDLAPILSQECAAAGARGEASRQTHLGDERFHLFDAASAFLRRTAERQPLVLVFDDMHVADESSLLLLRFCARDLRSAPLLILCTYRETEVRLQGALAAQFTALALEGRRVLLGGWGVEEVGEHLRQRADPRLPADLAAPLHRLTDGNPFFVEEVAREISAGRLEAEALVRDAAPLPVPDGVRQAIRRRLVSLPEPVVRHLRLAALVGREFDAGLLHRVALDDGTAETTLPKLIDGLEHAAAAGLLQQRGEEPGRYVFAHALVREALRHDVPPSQRMALHRAIGEALEARGGEPVRDAAAHLAHHFFQAAAAGAAAKAVEYAMAAARTALDESAYEDAARFWQQALDALRFLPADEPRRCQLLLALARAQRLAGRIPEAREAYRRGARLATSLGARELAARAALGFGRVGETGIVDTELVRLLERTLELLGGEEGVHRARILARLAMALCFSTEAAERDRCEPLSAQALEMARRLEHAEAVGHALIARHFVLWGPRGAKTRLALSAELVRVATEIGNSEMQLEAHLWRALDLLESGDGAGFTLECQTLHRRAEEVRLPLYRWHSQGLASLWALACGRVDEAERAAEAALALGERYHVERAQHFYAAQTFFTRRQQGRLLELEPAVRSFAERYAALPIWNCGLALLCVDAGRKEEAAQALEAAMLADPADWPLDGNWLPCLAILAEVCAALGDRARGARVRELLASHGGKQVVVFDGIALLGPVDHFLGLLALSTGDTPVATELLASAARQCDRLGAAALAERSRKALAEARAGAQVASAVTPAAAQAKVFRREGAYWTLAFGGIASRLRHSRGLSHLAHLLRHPGEEFHALEMASTAEAGRSAGAATASHAVGSGLGRRRGTAIRGDALLDAQAKAEYRQRLRDVQEELEEAQALNDLGRTAMLQEEMHALTAELSRALGLGGRSRVASSEAERARVAVTKAITLALKAIGESNPALQRHLARAIKTGTFCGYHGDPAEARGWALGE